mmetsp:Transcript_23487/g.36201  ORF Transcript_23487/g.36201 Transcript_23487/m.36201 type:complete len:683 (-) Transcript_23487:81-2129(-)|eukprot:CAMPEP_0196806270 /NCGR_PEP_ID=MMETSP1362-20130617/6159_1 /TAXON_ID=163516 /ORGANISM="Leptocylindrus danicus, Strain CCMP1856" /LENGTH=682 /DNA_ID=CAMNT_0042179677 /DNA_START=230 /DNA_END=2278 /DNA_ORIENTATION=+
MPRLFRGKSAPREETSEGEMTPQSTPFSFEDLSLADEYDFDEARKGKRKLFPRTRWFKKKKKAADSPASSIVPKSESVLDQAQERDYLYKLIVGARWFEVRDTCIAHPELLLDRVESSRRPPAISFNKTALHVACIFQAPKDVISVMLEANHNAIREIDESGKLPLHRAVSSSGMCASFDVIELLVKAYPRSILTRDSRNLTPGELARRVGARPEILEILADKEVPTINGEQEVNVVESKASECSSRAETLLDLVYGSQSSGATDDEFFDDDAQEKAHSASMATQGDLNQDAADDASEVGSLSELPSFPKTKTNSDDLSNEALGYRFCMKQDFANAKKYLEMAIQDVVSAKGGSDVKVAFLCNDLGNVNFELSDYAGAQKSYAEALKVQNLSLTGRANVMFNLGNVHFKIRDMHQALYHYDDALRCFGTKNSKQAQMYACLCNMKGLVYLKLGMVDEAIEYNKRTIGLEANSDETRAVQFRAYSSLGSAYYTLGQYEQSYTNFTRSLESKDEVVLYKSLHGMGNVCVKLGNLDKALQHYLKSLYLKRQKRGYRSVATACTLFNLAQVCRKLGRFQESLAHIDNLLLIHEGTLSNDNLDEAVATIEKAKTLNKNHDYEKAQKLYEDIFYKLSKLRSPKARELRDDVDRRMEIASHRAYESNVESLLGQDVADENLSWSDDEER